MRRPTRAARGVKEYVVYRGNTAVATVTTTSHTDSGLTASTQYSYQVSARDNASNESNRSAVVIATTLAAPDITATVRAGTGVTATATSATTVNVSWSAATDAGRLRCQGLHRLSRRCGGRNGRDDELRRRWAHGKHAVSPIKISARDNTDNESSRSARGQRRPLWQRRIPHRRPCRRGWLRRPAGATTVNVSWSAASDAGGSGVKDYIVYRGGVAVATVATTSFADTGLTASTLYAYEISARDNALNESARSAARNVTTLAASDTTPPSAPGTLTASAVSATQINLSWGAATDNVGVTGYRVERCIGAGCTTFAQYRDTDGHELQRHGAERPRHRIDTECGRWTPLTTLGPSPTSAARRLPRRLHDTTPPSAPGTLTANAASATQINLSWGAATDNVGVDGLSTGTLHRSRLHELRAVSRRRRGTTFSDTGLAASTSYSYRVRAADAAANLGAFSNTSSATTPGAAGDVSPPSAPGDVDGERGVLHADQSELGSGD